MDTETTLYWSDIAELTHERQVELFGWCSCEEQEYFPYDDCPKTETFTLESCSECRANMFSDEMCWYMATPVCPTCFVAENGEQV